MFNKLLCSWWIADGCVVGVTEWHKGNVADMLSQLCKGVLPWATQYGSASGSLDPRMFQIKMQMANRAYEIRAVKEELLLLEYEMKACLNNLERQIARQSVAFDAQQREWMQQLNTQSRLHVQLSSGCVQQQQQQQQTTPLWCALQDADNAGKVAKARMLLLQEQQRSTSLLLSKARQLFSKYRSIKLQYSNARKPNSTDNISMQNAEEELAANAAAAVAAGLAARSQDEDESDTADDAVADEDLQEEDESPAVGLADAVNQQPATEAAHQQPGSSAAASATHDAASKAAANQLLQPMKVYKDVSGLGSVLEGRSAMWSQQVFTLQWLLLMHHSRHHHQCKS